MPNAYTYAWTPEGYQGLNEGDPVDRSGGSDFAKLRQGDRLFILTLEKGTVYLLGAMTVSEVVDAATMKSLYGHAYADKPQHVLAQPGTASGFAFRPIPNERLGDLRFINRNGEVGLSFKDGRPDSQTLRRLRRITDQTAADLELLLARLGSLPPASAEAKALGLTKALNAKKPEVRNPTWIRDELIVMLDFYVRCKGNPPSKEGDDIGELSSFLNRMNAIQQGRAGDTFRNPNGVYMKLMNFRRFDPLFSAQGKVGLQRGGRGEEEVWDYFSSKPDELRAAANAIRAIVDAGEVLPAGEDDEVGAEAEEGRLLTRVHRSRERNRKLVKDKKDEVLKTKGVLECEVCAFDFGKEYGERGSGFIEVHHTRPVHTLKPGSKTKLSDLAVLCANCHRMVHARRPWLDLLALRQVRMKQKSAM